MSEILFLCIFKGCLIVELYLGIPLFMGNSQYDQLRKIIQVIGMPNEELLRQGKFTSKFFNNTDNIYNLKTPQQYLEDNQETLQQQSLQLIKISQLDDLIEYYSQSRFREEYDKKYFPEFLSLVKSLLKINPNDRLTATQALEHPFIQNNYHKIFDVYSLSSQELNKKVSQKDFCTKICYSQEQIQLIENQKNIKRQNSLNLPKSEKEYIQFKEI